MLHPSIYLHTSSKWRFYKNCICRVCEQIIVRQGAGVVLTHKWEQCRNCWGGCQKKFPVELKMRSEHRSLGFYQVQISKNPGLLTVIPWQVAKFSSVIILSEKVKNTEYNCTWIYLNIFLSIVYFIWCMERYTVKQTLASHNVTRSTKLRGAQRAPELAFRSTEFHSTENLIFPALSYQ